jgi:hypothetical protein
MRVTLAALLVVALTGCTPLRALQLQREDSAAVTTGKVAGRCVLAPLTLGGSEVVYACARDRAAEPTVDRERIWRECEQEGFWFFAQIAYDAGKSAEPSLPIATSR